MGKISYDYDNRVVSFSGIFSFEEFQKVTNQMTMVVIPKGEERLWKIECGIVESQQLNKLAKPIPPSSQFIKEGEDPRSADEVFSFSMPKIDQELVRREKE